MAAAIVVHQVARVWFFGRGVVVRYIWRRSSVSRSGGTVERIDELL
jgi:hypothetical protein